MIARKTPVPRHRADGAARRERNRGHRSRALERVHAGHVRAVAAGEDDDLRWVAGDLPRSGVELGERRRLDHTHTVPPPAELVEQPGLADEPLRATVDDDDGAHWTR